MNWHNGPSLPDAPWSEKCKALFPVLEELGRKYQNHSTVTIAKMDIMANDIQLTYLDRYPFFRLFPIDSQQVRGSWGPHTWKYHYVIIMDPVSPDLQLSLLPNQLHSQLQPPLSSHVQFEQCSPLASPKVPRLARIGSSLGHLLFPDPVIVVRKVSMSW